MATNKSRIVATDETRDVRIVPRALSVEEAARYLGLSRASLYLKMSAGVIPARKHGQRTLILREDLDTYLAGLPMAFGTSEVRS